MSNAKKIIESSKTDFEKVRKTRLKKVKVEWDKLDDAIVDGKLVVPVKGRVVFERQYYKRVEVREGHVVGISDKGIVDLYDDTMEQFYSFDIAQPQLRIKSLVPLEKKQITASEEAAK